MNSENFKGFTNLYSLSKTIRFGLKPIGQTLENIQKSDILLEDEHRADSYKKIKKIIDEYHKKFIETSLHGIELDKETLFEYFTYFKIASKDESQKERYKELQSKLRKQIANAFDTQHLFGREFIREDLLEFATSEEERELIKEFRNFTTYFTGFYESRQNIYSAEDKSTAIAYRLINENLPKFINNIVVFEKVAKSSVGKYVETLYRDFEEYMNVFEIKDLFSLDYYSSVLTQIQIDAYNLVIVGKVLEDGTKIKGLNEYVNLYNQSQIDKNAHLPKFTTLFKQILSDRNVISWLPDEFASDSDVLESVEKVFSEINENALNSKVSLKNLLLNIDEYDLSKIYLRNDTGLSGISQQFLGSYSVIEDAIKDNYKKNNPRSTRQNQEKYDEKVERIFKTCDSFSIGFIDECLGDKSIVDYCKAIGKKENTEDLFALIEQNYIAVRELLSTPYPKDKDLKQDKQNVEKIKLLLDSIKTLQRFIKPLLGKEDEADRDGRFYGEFDKLWNELNKITPLYNMVRNYVTKKPYLTEKFKLNFENSTLLAGWDVNKEQDNTSVLLRKEGLYYLAIMDKKHNRVFAEQFNEYDDCYEKMDYKLLPGANKMLPKVFFSNSRIGEFNPSERLLENYGNGTHRRGDKFNINDCRGLIDFFKSSIQKHEDWKKFDFHFSDTSDYNDLGEFYREVEQQGYKITFRNIPTSYIDKLVEDGKIYLFQIYNKDFSPYNKGTPNIHTLYWKALFSMENLKNVVYKLNGQAEVFFRKRSIKDEHKVVHVAQKPIGNKNGSSLKKQSVFQYDIVKDKRYTADKFQFHVPITINFKAVGNEQINEDVNRYIRDGNIRHIIGIDRGERHLLYLSLIDLEGNIIKQFSLNEIISEYNNAVYKTDYHDLLNKREKGVNEAQQSWQAIKTIKELKEGYISQVVHKIAQLTVEYNAIVVLEDLNFGFKNMRKKVKKEIYQKFEKMLIDKLNYLVDKKKKPEEEGGLFNAYQLTNKFKSFKEMGKQNGFLFYIPAWNTSNIDPITGFVNLFNTRYTNLENSRAFFEKFADIRYNNAKNYFEFIVDNYSKFNPKAETTRLDWTICTNDKRIKTFRNPQKNSQWDNEEIVLNSEFVKLFNEYNINYMSNLKNAILKQTKKEFFEELLHLFKLMVQMRNSVTNSDTDYIISPVADKNGDFYDSRKAKENLPDNADANGAYNIARKGLWAIEQIKQADNLRRVNLAISNKNWLQYVQNHE
ncbi:MAG: type V CRISPR-associated protein Cas12a/Cpf1 [Campylobacteraceae bacterium]|jgi:CRISPR-associated protein Cpf1|nr:type V CRISPR-associated protein Cas12a/Cpf1 [Campylobacteraceae bacterium]